MSVNPMTTALMVYLREASPLYYGKVQELREIIRAWLSYIPQTFPHYTRHTIEHSEEIILQLSKLLFVEEDAKRPTITLSSTEVYILVASAYLHDAGMVASDSEKLELLKQDTWKNWTSGNGGGERRWAEIQSLRNGLVPEDEEVRHFIADFQTRFLIAEFIRGRHHLRVADIIGQHQSTLGRFAFDDLQLQHAIANVCLGHGLSLHELDDVQNYPERRDIRGEPVNVRFLSLLLRIGDLLDMSYDRACPLLLSAACPLPANTFAYWSQYKMITHRLTAPDRIEISAECNNQEEHRILQDWCQWLVEEVENAGVVMVRAARHRSWQPPYVNMKGSNKTIQISPSKSATYIPSKWVFEFDQDAILQRLIADMHYQPFAFVLELIQNALDATRCKMYLDLMSQGKDPPEYPNQVDEDIRRTYPVHLTLCYEDVHNELSGEIEKKQKMVVDDCGIGMDSRIIQSYFLQVGRSYYTSEEYRRIYKFHPTSQFGIGFLSVFGVSDHVTVETYKPTSDEATGPIRITLVGPRNYLLTERGKRQVSGTRIEVVLKDAIEPSRLTEIIRSSCRKVEFPIIVNDVGKITTIESETFSDFMYELPDLIHENSKFIIRCFPLEQPPLWGELYVFAHVDKNGERWDQWHWSRYSYPNQHPQASTPRFVSGLYCFHGIAVSGGYEDYVSSPMAARVDYRGTSQNIDLLRQRFVSREWYMSKRGITFPEVSSRWEEILDEHLRTSPPALAMDGWKYKQCLVSDFPLQSYWEGVPGTIRMYMDSEYTLHSLKTVVSFPVIRVIMRWPWKRLLLEESKVPEPDPQTLANSTGIILTHSDLECLSDTHRRAVFSNRVISGVCWTSDNHLFVDWKLAEDRVEALLNLEGEEHPIEGFPLAHESTIGFRIHHTTDSNYEHCILNITNPLGAWIFGIKKRCSVGDCFVDSRMFRTLVSLLHTPLSYGGMEVEKLESYLKRWREIPNLSAELYPPDISLSQDMFVPRPPQC